MLMLGRLAVLQGCKSFVGAIVRVVTSASITTIILS